MLTSLVLQDVVLIQALALEPRQGLTALTGETGAGKSILLDGLALCLGARADATLVRGGASVAIVTAEFDPPQDHPARALLAASGVAVDGPVLLRRTVKSDGGSRAFINDQPVGLALMREVGETLIEIHGQQDDRGLLNPRGHRALLDAFGGLESQVDRVSAAHAQWTKLVDALAAARAALAQAQADEAYLSHAAAEIGRLAPQPGEEQQLAADRTAMLRSEKVSGDLTAVLAGLGGSDGAGAQLRQAARRLERISADEPALTDSVADLDAAIERVAEAEQRLERWLAASAFEPARLETMETRLFDLRALARKHKVSVEALPALREEIDAKLASLALGADEIARLETAMAAAWQSFAKQCGDLSKARALSARRLDKAVAAELVPLKLDRAKFHTRVDVLPEAQWTAAGSDRVEFEIATNPGAPFGPLTRIASGGELSRFILALKVALAATGSAGVLIFDEIDRGVGGAVAAAIGERLARLARDVQVLLVTHSPQVAARAEHHWRIRKTDGKTATTHVEALDHDGRCEEIARMLSGDQVTPEARAQAARLLAAE